MTAPKGLTRRTPTSRAVTAEGRSKVRQAFIETGRHLFVTQEGGQVSLRQIAAAAGYSPGTIYQYFRDYRALQVAIRELDMEEATKHFASQIARVKDPAERVRELCRITVRYWMEHLDAFDQLFGRGPHLPVLLTDDGTPFGSGGTVQRALDVYYGAVADLFASWPAAPVPERLAADILIGTTYGLISFPRYTRPMKWSETSRMVDAAVDGLLAAWEMAARRAR